MNFKDIKTNLNYTQMIFYLTQRRILQNEFQFCKIDILSLKTGILILQK